MFFITNHLQKNWEVLKEGQSNLACISSSNPVLQSKSFNLLLTEQKRNKKEEKSGNEKEERAPRRKAQRQKQHK